MISRRFCIYTLTTPTHTCLLATFFASVPFRVSMPTDPPLQLVPSCARFPLHPRPRRGSRPNTALVYDTFTTASWRASPSAHPHALSAAASTPAPSRRSGLTRETGSCTRFPCVGENDLLYSLYDLESALWGLGTLAGLKSWDMGCLGARNTLETWELGCLEGLGCLGFFGT